VIETAELPAPTAALGIYRAGSGPPEPLGRRIIEVPQDQQQHDLRNPGAEYLAYVPVGSIARGRTLALEGRPGMTPACASCHGPDLRGVGLIPPIAGRFPVYLVRQLLAFKSGTRSTPAGAPMRLVAATLDLDDMISAAAYAATQAP
jgi:cytochrome c553